MDARAVRAIERLPESAAAKLRELELQRALAEDQHRAVTARLAQTRPDDPMAELLSDERHRLSSEYGQLQQLLSRVLQFLAETPAAVVFESVPAISVELKPDEKLTDALAAVRSEIGALRQQLETTRRAALPKDEQLALVKSYALRLLQRPRVTIQGGQLSVAWPETAMAEDVAALLCWLQPIEFIEALTHELESQPHVGVALKASEREARLREIQMKISDLEFHEENLIMKAAADGLELPRRIDASAAIVLGVRIATTPQVQAVA